MPSAPMHPIVEILFIVIDLYMWALIIAVILSWLVAFNVVNRRNQFVFAVGDFSPASPSRHCARSGACSRIWAASISRRSRSCSGSI